MTEPSHERLEALLREQAAAIDYPPTPDVVGGVRQRLELESPRPSRPVPQWVGAMFILVFVLGALLAVPQVRAELLEFLKIGVVRIFPVAPTPTATLPPLTATPRPAATPLLSLLNLAGETTLDEARAEAGFVIRLPTSPLDLGSPDKVFLQDLGGPLVVLVWLEPDDPSRVRLSLHQFGAGTFADKVEPKVIQATEVNGQPALWVEGPYLVQTGNGDYVTQRLVEGHVLIWEVEEITYRLESKLTLEEAVQIAESLK
jgi:hypothetical protein